MLRFTRGYLDKSKTVSLTFSPDFENRFLRAQTELAAHNWTTNDVWKYVLVFRFYCIESNRITSTMHRIVGICSLERYRLRDQSLFSVRGGIDQFIPKFTATFTQQNKIKTETSYLI